MNLRKPDFKLEKPDVKVPKVVEDVYQDLRDRKLLPIVALLVVAIVAVPILLSSGGSSTPSVSQAPPAELVDAPEAQSAVLAEDPGLRNYQQRLDDLKAKNPFDQQFQVTASVASTDDGAAAADTGSVTGLGGGSSTDAPSGGGGSADTAADAVTDETSVTIDETVNEPPSDTSGLYTFHVDLEYGPEGDVKKYKDVKLLDVLEPVGAFIGGTENGKKAVFAMSSDVAAVTGEGQCAPTPGNCEFLLMKEGQSAGITYQPDDAAPAVVYKLAIDEIRLVQVKNADLEGKLAD